MLLDAIKAKMFSAMKAGNVVEKEILRVAVGEITTEAARPGRKGSDEEVEAILRKLIKSNEESLAAGLSADREAVLRQEIGILATFLPKSLSVDEIVATLLTGRRSRSRRRQRRASDRRRDEAPGNRAVRSFPARTSPKP